MRDELMGTKISLNVNPRNTGYSPQMTDLPQWCTLYIWNQRLLLAPICSAFWPLWSTRFTFSHQ